MGYNVNVSDDQQPEFRSLSEYYIFFFNKLKIVVDFSDSNMFTFIAHEIE